MNAVFAVNSIDGFGVDNTMPWPRSSVDLKRFKDITNGHTVVMGASTWLSDMPKPLPNRRNIVLSTTLVDERCEVCRSITELLMTLKDSEEVYVIGGATVLWALRSYINRVYFTRHNSAQRADITLSTNEYFDGFHSMHSEHLDEHMFDIYVRD